MSQESNFSDDVQLDNEEQRIIEAIDTKNLDKVKDELGSDVGVGPSGISVRVLTHALTLAENQKSNITKQIFDYLYENSEPSVKKEFHDLGFMYPGYSSGKGGRKSRKSKKTRKGKSKKTRKTRGRRRV